MGLRTLAKPCSTRPSPPCKKRRSIYLHIYLSINVFIFFV